MARSVSQARSGHPQGGFANLMYFYPRLKPFRLTVHHTDGPGSLLIVTKKRDTRHRGISWGIHELPKVLLEFVMPYHSTPCGKPTLQPFQEWPPIKRAHYSRLTTPLDTPWRTDLCPAIICLTEAGRWTRCRSGNHE
jgi:hypothetical protein